MKKKKEWHYDESNLFIKKTIMTFVKPKFRIGQKTRSWKFTILAYIDARDVEFELDRMYDNNRSCDHTIIKDDDRWVVVECRITAWWQTRSDIGFHKYEKYQNWDNYEVLHKSAYNDAFKRAWVKFGIWRYLYDAPTMFITEQDKETYQYKLHEYVKKTYSTQLQKRHDKYK